MKNYLNDHLNRDPVLLTAVRSVICWFCLYTTIVDFFFNTVFVQQIMDIAVSLN